MSFEQHLRITEVFHSIQGESTRMGLPSVFVRLTGCPLRCHYCDTAYAFSGGTRQSIDSIMEQVGLFSCNTVCVTGGEPLAQPGCLTLLNRLCNAHYDVSLETSGALDISAVDSRVMIVMDLKTPDSGEVHKNLWDNIDCLKMSDQIKFVICSRSDYEWSCRKIEEHQLTQKATVLLSPSWGQLEGTQLAEWMLQDKLNVRFQLQLHKILWNDAPGR